MAHPNDQFDSHDPELPGALATLLREHAGADRPLDEGETGVEARIDEAVMRAAREQLEHIDPPKPLRFPAIVRTITGLGLAAAAIGIVVYFGPAPQSTPPAGSGSADLSSQLAKAESSDFAEDELAFAREAEADTMGGVESMRTAQPSVSLADAAEKITIRDAYRVALALDSGDTPDLRYDETGDGVVDQNDIDALARIAVRLNEPRGFGAATPTFTPTLGVFLHFSLASGSVMP
jgi:hypothetical protein